MLCYISTLKGNPPGDPIINESNYGREFWFSPIPYYRETISGIAKYRIYAQSGSEAKITLEIMNKGYSNTKTADVGKPAIWELSDTLAQAALSYIFYSEFVMQTIWDTPTQTFKGAGIHIRSDEDISVFVFLYYPWESEALSLIPVGRLGKEYVLPSYRSLRDLTLWKFPSMATITAVQDSTVLDIRLGGTRTTALTFPDNRRIFSNDSFSVELNRGDVFFMQNDNRDTNQDLSGSLIRSNKPVALVGGHMCTFAPLDGGTCNCVSEMAAPTMAWGKDFLIPAFRNRKLYGLVRIYTNTPNTLIYRDGVLFDSIPYDPANQRSSFIERRLYPVRDSLKKIIPIKNAVISSNNDISVYYFNPCFVSDMDVLGYDDPKTDPFMLEIASASQFTNYADVLLPTAADTAILDLNYADVIFETDTYGKIPEDILITNKLDDVFVTNRLLDFHTDTVKRFPVLSGGKYYSSISLGMTELRHFALSSTKSRFIVYSYGYDVQDAYAYTAARLYASIPADTVPPGLIGDIGCDGNLIEAEILDKSINFASIITSVWLDSADSYNYSLDYKPDTLNSQSVRVTLRVLEPTANARAILHISDKSGNDTSYIFNYIGTVGRDRLLYPNPAVEKNINLRIFTCEDELASLRLWDYAGRLVHTYDNIPVKKGINIITLNLNEYSSGAYFLEIVTPEPQSIHKFILRKE